jgi:hypothetical protein
MLSDGKEITPGAPDGLRINEFRAQLAPGYWGMDPGLLVAKEPDVIHSQYSYRVLADIGSS